MVYEPSLQKEPRDDLKISVSDFRISLAQADCNQDGVVDFADIPRFVAILSNS